MKINPFRSSSLCVVSLLAAAAAWAQPPSISAVVNGASYLSGAIAPGEIANVFGSNLSSASQNCVSGGVAPTVCNNTSVLINGSAVPLEYVSASQVIFIVPYGISGSTATVKVSNPNGQSGTLTFPVAPASPGIFTANSSGTGNGLFLNSSFQVITSGITANPGDTVLGYAVGLGIPNPALADGIAVPASPLYYTAATVGVTVGGVPAHVLFAGLAPGQVGTYQVNFVVPAGLSGNQPVVFTVDGIASASVNLPVTSASTPALSITSPSNFGTWTLGENQLPLLASGGNGSYTWAYVSGTLPPGLSLRTDGPSFFPPGTPAGLIGVATTPGDYTFTLSVTSGSSTVQQAFTMRITGLNLKGSNLPDAFVGSAYLTSGYQLTAINGSGSPVTVTWTYNSGIPNGMTLSSTGLLSGAPSTAGSYNVNFSFTDGTDTVYRTLSLNVSAVQFTSPGMLPNVAQNASYNYTLAASGGTGPYTYAQTGGTLPNGLTLSAGAISGTVNAGQGKYGFNVTVTDSQSHSYSKNMSIDVIGTPENMPQLNPYGNLDDCTIGQGYSGAIGVNGGGTAPFTWNVTGLPPGMDFRYGSGATLNYLNVGDVELWGTPTAVGAYTVTATATDANGLSVTQSFPLRVSALTVDRGLPNGTVGVPYASTLRIVGGVPPYTAALVPTPSVPGTLPAGTSLAGLAVTGTPQEGGQFNPLFRFTDSAGTANTMTITQWPYISGAAGTSTTVNYYSTQYATQNQPYSLQLGACCAASYTWGSTGTLPHGIALSSGGLLNGTPDTAGTYTFLVQATQTGVPSNYGTRQITIVVTPLTVTTGNALPYGNVNVFYSQTLTATGGTGSLTWSLAPGSFLPPGLFLNGTTGAISGTPTAPGQFNFNVNVSDSANPAHTGLGYFNLAVYPTGGAPPVVIATGANMGTWTLGQVQTPLVATGGTGSYTWSFLSGTLPPGLSLRTDVPSYFPPGTAAGLIGVATTPNASPGASYSFTLQVTSGSQSVSQAFTMRITGLNLKDGNLPDAFVGAAYMTPGYQLTAISGSGSPVAVTWTYTSGIPAGMTLSSSGLLSGTPTAAGSYNINFNFTDGVDTVYRSVHLNVSAVQITSPGLLPSATLNSAYTSYTLTASGGTSPYTFAITGGGLPNGMTLNSGVISGTPTNAGQGKYSINVMVTDHSGVSYTKYMAIYVLGTPENMPQVNQYGNLDDCTIGMGCSRGFGAYGGGTPSLTWSVTGLPPGMDFRSGSGTTQSNFTASDLELWGAPTALGTYNVTITATDANNLSTTQVFPLKISALWVDTGLPNGTVGVPYSAPFRLIGGVLPYTAMELPTRNVPGTLPAGTSLSGLTVSGTPTEGGWFYPLFRFTDSASTANTLTITQYPYISGVAGTTTTVNYYSTQYVTLNHAWSMQLGACCATSYTWTQPSGTLPHNVTLSSGGLLSGTPDTAGTYTFLVQATQVGNSANYGTRQIVVVVTPLAVTTPGTLPYGNVNVVYPAQTLAASGGTGALTWSLASGQFLPPGLSLNGATGVISGTPTAVGQYNFNVNVSDSAVPAHSAVGYFNMAVYATNGAPPLVITTGASFGTYSIGEIQVSLIASGGTGTYTWSQTGGTLPPGLALRTDTPSWFPSNAYAGLMGVATTPNATAGTSYSFTLQVASGSQSVSQTFTMRITGLTAMENLYYRLPDAFVQQSPQYSYQLTPLNNAGTVTWTAVSGLPPGLIMSSTGLISGTPTTAGYYNVNYRIADGVDTVSAYSQWLVINVSTVQLTSPGLLPNATQNAAYTPYTLTASGGTPPYTFSVNAQSLPSGLTLTGATISGTETGGPGLASFNVTVTDANHVSYTKTVAVDIIGVPPALPFVAAGNLDDCTIGISCERQIQVLNGGTAPFTWNVTGLPPGMNFRYGSGNTQYNVIPGFVEIYGAPLQMQAGGFTIAATVTDANGATETGTYSLNVSPLFIDGNGSLPPGTRGVAYSKLLQVLGGSASYTVQQLLSQSFPFPDGLTLSGMTVSGTPLENDSFSPLFLFADTAGNTLQIHESFSIGGGTSTISLGQSKFLYEGGPGYYSSVIGYYTVGASLSYRPYVCCVPSYTWSQIGGALPPGITLDSTGLLSGTFTTAGTYDFLLSAADSTNLSNFGVKQFTIVVSSLNITTSSPLPYGNVQTAYSSSLSSNVSATFTLVTGNYLPPGLTLDASGLIHGTPTTTGLYYFYVQAVDVSNSSNVFYKQFNISIYANGAYPPLFLGTGPNLGPYRLGARTIQLTASGGKPPYHYSLTPGATPVPGYRVQDGPPLPNGFSLSGGTGGFIGVLATAGSWNTSLRVTDANGTTFDRPVSITATSLNILNPGNPPNATQNVPYSFTFTGYGGTGIYTWSATNLPAGLSMNSTTGTISGTPTGSGSTATITITDSTPVSVGLGYTINVDPFAITTGGVLPQGTIGVAYSQTLNAPACAAGGTGSIVSGSLPGGLSFNSSTGAITGTPTGFSNSTFTVQANCSNGTVQKRFSLLVPFNTPQPLFISSPVSPIAYTTFGTQNVTLFAQGGTPPYTWSVANGSTLPPGLSLQTPGETIGSLYNPGFTYLAGRVMQAGSGPGASYTFTLQVTDAANNTATQTYTFIAPLMALDVGTWPISNPGAGTYATTYPPLIYNTSYTQAQLAEGGSGNYISWTTPLASNPMPPGLNLDPHTGVISGIPTNTGSFTTLIQVADDAGNMLQWFVYFNIAANTPSTVTIGLGPNLGNYPAGGNNTFNINPSGGTGPYIITALSTLPPGCAIETGSALLSTGTGSYDLACVYLAAGSYSFTLQAQDSLGNIGVKTINMNVVPFILFSSASLPNGSVGVPYSEQILAFDNSAAVLWSISASSALPPGMNLSGSTLGGTPSQAGSYSFTLVASDGSGPTVSYTFSLVISTIHITTPDIIPVQAITNTPYSFTFAATGGGTKTWSATGLPSGITMFSAGALSGTTTSTGTFRVTVTVTDGTSTYVHPFTLFARYSDPTLPTIAVLTAALSDARVGQSVSYTLSPSGGVPPYTWTVAPGSSLPPGFSLYSGASLSVYSSSQTVGLTYLAGTPTTAAPYTFDLIATDSVGTQLRRTFTLNVKPMAIESGSLKTAVTGVAYSQQLTAAGGTPPYSFTYAPSSLTTDMLPPGFTPSASGLISGTTTSTGSFGFVATAHDNAGHTFSTTYTLTVTNASGLYVSTGPLFGARLGVGTSTTLATGGGTSTYTWSVSAGVLPNGLALVPSGSSTLLAGAPAAYGTFNYTLRATDNANSGNFADRAYTVVIGPMQLISHRVNSMPPARIGTLYSYTYQLAGGTPPYTFAASPLSPPPPGLSLSAGGTLSGNPTVPGTYSFTYQITDAHGYVGYLTPPAMDVLPVGLNDPLQGRSSTLGPSVGSPYAVPLDTYATGGVLPFTWSVAPGSSLPAGMSILPGGNGVSSYLGGIPTTAGTSAFTLIVTDAVGQTGSSLLTFGVSPIAALPWSVPNGVVGASYAATYTPSGGTAPYTFALTTGTSLPPGLSLSGTGSTATLSGTPTSPGVFSVTVTIADQGGNALTTSRTVVIDNAGQAQGIAAPDLPQLSYVLGSPAPSFPINITATSGTIPFNAMVSGIPGATLSPISGNASAGLTLTLNPSALSVGTSVGVVAVNSPQAANGYAWTPVVLTVSPAPPCSYSLDSSGISVPAGTTYSNSFNVLTGGNCPWTAAPSDGSWITVSGGGPGGGPVSYSLAQNGSSSQRTGTINIVVSGQTVQSFSITEFGLSCSYGITPSVVNNLSPAATSITVNVAVSASGCPAWTATGLGAPSGSFTGNGSVTLSIPANNTALPQTSTATVAGQSFTAVQNPAACTVTLSSYAVEIPAAGSGTSPYTVGVAIPTGCTYSSSASSGVAIQSGGSGSGPGTLYYSVASNSTTVTQNLAINIGDKTLAITQDALPCSVTLDASGVNGTLAANGGGPFPILVNANGNNCSWTASSPVSWAAVSPTSGTGSGAVNLTLTSNAASTTSRTTSPPLNIAGNNVSITQAGTTCTWQLPSATGTVPYSGGTGAASVVAPGVCGWSGQSNNPAWLHITSSGTGGSGNVVFVADPNPANTPRAGTIAIVGATPALTYSVTQAAAPCSYTLGTTSSGLVSSDGYSGSFLFSTATAGCSPSPQSFAGWLHITGTAFTGSSGMVSFSVDPNPNGSTRGGQIKLEDGSTYSVSQSGASCAFSLNAYSIVFNTNGGTGSVQGSPSANGCSPSVGTSQPSIVAIGSLSGPTLNIYTLPYTVFSYVSAAASTRKAYITFGGQVYAIKQTSW